MQCDAANNGFLVYPPELYGRRRERTASGRDAEASAPALPRVLAAPFPRAAVSRAPGPEADGARQEVEHMNPWTIE